MPATYVVDGCCRRRCGLWAGCNRAPGRIHCVSSAGSVLGALKLRHRRLLWALWLSSNFVLALSGADESKRVVVIHLVAAVKLIFMVCFSLFIDIRRARTFSIQRRPHPNTTWIAVRIGGRSERTSTRMGNNVESKFLVEFHKNGFDSYKAQGSQLEIVAAAGGSPQQHHRARWYSCTRSANPPRTIVDKKTLPRCEHIAIRCARTKAS